MFSLKELLENNGHKFIPFSVAYTRNKNSAYQKYFIRPPGDPSIIYFSELNLSMLDKLKFALNAIYSLEAKTKLRRLIEDIEPDIMHTLQIHTFMSYSVIDAAKEHGLPIVSRMSNYQLMCPSELFFRKQGVCEECKKTLFNAVRYKCIQKSTAGSAIRVASLIFHRMKRTFSKIDRFIVPSRFLADKMIDYGFPADKISHVPSFINTEDFTPEFTSDGYIVYSGRIAEEKGIQFLIEAYVRARIKPELYIIGEATDEEGARIQKYVQERNISKVRILGYQPLPKLKEIIKKSLFTICPSKWYENTPMSTYESFALGKPVLGANLGSIPEQIIDGRTGLLFEPNNIEDLAEKLNYLADHPKLVIEMGREARRIVETHHSPEIHYNHLMKIYEQLI